MNQSTAPSELTPKHVRAARALLAWSQQDLAKAAGVATSTVADFERGQRTPVANNALAIRNALEAAGISFLAGGAIHGPPIPAISPSQAPAMPVRWIDSQDLSAWADRMDGAESLPTLISNLIRATHGAGAALRFPSNEGVRHSGWDGITEATTGSLYVPQGMAGWEIGSQRRNIPQKATEDYAKRTASPGEIDPPTSTYVFVTPRHWPGKGQWAKSRRADGPWMDVKVYDADDLVHWIELAPAVGLWLASRIGRIPSDARQLSDIWNEWSLATKWPLPEDLVLSDRDEDSKVVHEWLRGAPSVLSLQSTSSEEVLAFFHATLNMLPPEQSDNYRVRALVMTSSNSARELLNAPGPLIILMSEPDSGLARSLAKKGHYVLQAYDDRPIPRGEVRRLNRPSREGIAAALEIAGISRPRAEALARDSARNLAILRRLIPAADERVPSWATQAPPRALIAALLVGGWNEDLEADRSRLSELAGQPYEQVVSALAPYVGALDSPLLKLSSTWKMASPLDAWFYLAPYLTSQDVERFESTVYTVLGSSDARFDMKPDERWLAPVKGISGEYSGLIRHGIGEVLILLTLWGKRAHLVAEPSLRVDNMVSRLLGGADQKRWWSLSRDFQLLAEASPSRFMSAIEESLDQEDPPIRALFGQDDDGVFGAEHISDLLWALESLAWSPDLMPKVSYLLARLVEIDTPNSRYSNRPSNSLREIHLLWSPQTYATLKERLAAIDMLRRRVPRVSWNLLLGILPQGHDTSSPSPVPKWRDYSIDRVETVTYGLIARGAQAVSDRLIEDVGSSPERWGEILDRLTHLAPDASAALRAFDSVEGEITDTESRSQIWKKLRHVLSHHRQYPDSDWSMQKEYLDELEVMYHRFAPADHMLRLSWLFDQSVELPNPSNLGWESIQREIGEARKEAVADVFAQAGSSGILRFSTLVERPDFVGRALFDTGLKASEIESIVEVALGSGDTAQHEFGQGLASTAVHKLGRSWGSSIVSKALKEPWSDEAITLLFLSLPSQRWVWEMVDGAHESIRANYWRRVPIYWMSDESEDVEYAIRELIRAGRARESTSIAGRDSNTNLPSSLLIEVLSSALEQRGRDQGGNEATMFQHYISEMFNVLEERDDVNQRELAILEWKYLQLLENSRHPPRALMRALAEQPSLFITFVSFVYKPREDSNVKEESSLSADDAQAMASQAWRLLEKWNRIPGTQDDGTIDKDQLVSWMVEARTLAESVGREDVADSRIGVVLSSSPMGEDGNWPAKEVRYVLDHFRSEPMLTGFWVGKRNRRGVTSRGMRDGGQQERDAALSYREWAKNVELEYPYTANALRALADGYEREATDHDESVERLDWQ